MRETKSNHQELANQLASLFSKFPSVEGIALGGSQMTGVGDTNSDIDLYIFTTADIPLVKRKPIIEKFNPRQANLDQRFWDYGDEWFDGETGIEVDMMYWDTKWIEGQLDRVLTRHQASTGYTTCHWHTILKAQVLFDHSGWLHNLKKKANQPYPEMLRNAIIAKNHPLIRNAIPAYIHQIEKAIQRNDLVSINHRVAGLLASYFDILFAVNRIPNPGEKRLLTITAQSCEKVPPGLAEAVGRILKAACTPDANLLDQINILADGVDQLLLSEGFDPQTSLPVLKPD